MKIQSLSSLLVTGACLVLSGCVESPDPFDVEDLDVPLETADGPDVKNGTGPADMFEVSVMSMIYDLQWAGLDDGTGTLRLTPTMALAPPASRKKVLADLVGCALGDSDTLVDPIDSTSYTGHVGLAASWRSQALTSVSDQRFVSACLLQHLNGLGYEVWLLLEGNTPALQPNAEERGKFSVTDSALWGNLFVKLPQLYACALPDVTAACTTDIWIENLDKRICDSSPACHLTIVGACADECLQDGATGLWSCPAWGYAELIASRTRPEDGTYLCLP